MTTQDILSPEEAAAKRKAESEAWAKKIEENQRLAVPREIDKLQKELASLEGKFKLFPDLRRYEGRWGKVALYAKSANSQVTGYDTRHNCGCCVDSPLELWPYAETEWGPVYSDPPKFHVGHGDGHFGDYESSEWETQLEAAGIPLAPFAALHGKFKKDADRRDQLEDEDDES